MATFDDRTFNTLRAQSDKKATKNQGAIATRGGIYVAKNLKCDEEIDACKLVVKGLSKIGGDLSVGGTIYCPDVYTINEDVIKMKRNLVPDRLKNPTKPDELASLGTKRDPWPIVCADTIKCSSLCAKHILAGDVKVRTIEIGCLPTLTVGSDSQPLLDVQSDGVNVSTNFNIVNPETNEIAIGVSGGCAESFIPIYQQWDSFQSTFVNYCPSQTLYICTSYNFINIGNCDNLQLNYDGNRVPINTKVCFYFVDGNQVAKAQYILEVMRCGKKFTFKSKIFVKKIKLVFVENHIYLI